MFSRPQDAWHNENQTAQITASPGAGADKFGDAVATDRATIAVGAPNNARGGGVYVFDRPASGWRNATQSAILNETDSSEGNDLGQSLAISRQTILAGDPTHKLTAGYASGVVYLFVRPRTGWLDATQTQILVPPGAADNEAFGAAVAVTPTTVVIGAPSYRASAKKDHRGEGRVYAFSSSPDRSKTGTAQIFSFCG